MKISRLIPILFLVAFQLPASAEFRVCNKTSSRVGIAIGFREGPINISQGWFNLKPNSCDTPIKEDLKSGPYFVYGVDYDHGGEWSGKELLCISDREFYVESSKDCYSRGYDRAAYRRLDTNGQKNWTLEITDQKANPASSLPSAPVTSLPGNPAIPLLMQPGKSQ